MRIKKSIKLLVMVYILLLIIISGIIENIQTGRLTGIILSYKENDQLNIADSVSANLRNYIRQPFDDITELNEILNNPLLARSKSSVDLYLMHFIKHNYLFEKIMILDRNGMIVDMVPEDKSLLGMDMSRHSSFVTDSAAWSDSFLSQESGNVNATITLPFKGGCIVGFLNLTFLNSVVSLQNPFTSGFISVVDRKGVVIVSSDEKMSAEHVNLKSMTSINITGWTNRIFKGEDSDIYGREGFVTAIPVPENGWIVVLFQSGDEINSIRNTISIISYFVLAATILSLLLITYIIINSILNPVNRLSEQTAMIAGGNYDITIEPVYSELEYFTRNFMKMVKEIREREDVIKSQSEALMETNRLLEESNSDLTESNKIIEKSLKEKEILLRELYHRTKNNMQVINSLLVLHSDSADSEETKNAFFEMKNRIQTMSLVHQKLYQSNDLSSISMKEYVTELVSLLMTSYRTDTDRIAVKYDLHDIRLIFDIAVPLGLFLNELISNSLRHAFPDGRKGEISISLKKSDDASIMLEVSDNGIGLPQGFSLEKNSGIGLKTAFSIGELQLDGRVETDFTGGFLCRLTFSGDIYSLRI